MRALLAAAILLGLGIPARAGDRDFDAVVQSIESTFQTRRTSIPLFGVAKFFVKISRPGGAKQLDLAIFEDLHIGRSRLQELDQTVREAAGERWSPMIRVRDRQEWVTIYARPDGKKDMALLIATVEPGEATVIRLKVDAAALARMIDESPNRAGKCLVSEQNDSEQQCED
ncbi:MAG TPA: hypothetical protein VN428_07935 [Bryobacteraceae bacterium]|nr:hypothetical protein [Bryobacteraceae bacterium]